MAGHVLLSRLREEGYTVYGTSRFADHYHEPDIYSFDASDDGSWFRFFDTFDDLDVVVNCIGVLTKAAEKNPSNATRINALLPNFLESYYKNSSVKVVQISTDCVFNGLRGEYTTDMWPNETHIYGRSKAFGEIINSKDLTIRTSIIGLELEDKPNSADNCGLLHWFLSRPRGSQISGYSECYWSGISTLELADAIVWYLNNPACGLHHVSRRSSISKFELLVLANEIFDRGIIIVKDSEKVIDKGLTPSQGSYTIRRTYRQMLKRLRDGNGLIS